MGLQKKIDELDELVARKVKQEQAKIARDELTELIESAEVTSSSLKQRVAKVKAGKVLEATDEIVLQAEEVIKTLEAKEKAIEEQKKEQEEKDKLEIEQKIKDMEKKASEDKQAFMAKIAKMEEVQQGYNAELG